MLLVGSIFLAAAIYFLASDVPIWLFGKNVPGRIEELWAENVSEADSSELSFKYYLRYSFQTEDGRRYENFKSLSATEWSSQAEGGQIEITYFPLIPSHNRINASRFIILFLCMYIPIIAIGWTSFVFGSHLLSIDKSNGTIDTWKSFYLRRFKKA